MVHHMTRSAGLLSLCAMTVGLVACGAPQGADDGSSVEAAPQQAAASMSAPKELPGMPEFLKPPHERNSEEKNTASTANRVSSGYHYAQGQFDDSTFYGVYTYIDDSWTYMSTSIWSSDSSSMSSGMDISSSGDTWLQSGNYYVSGTGSARGDYATTYAGAGGNSTVYLTDFSSDANSSHYVSSIDYSNTSASPDCSYVSDWSADKSGSSQSCVRPNGSSWGCDYDYSYTPVTDVNGDTVSVQYTSTQICRDSATGHNTQADPAYSYSDSSIWDYASSSYEDHATMMCYESNGSQRTFYYDYVNNVGSWTDDNGQPVQSPTCGWEQDNQP